MDIILTLIGCTLAVIGGVYLVAVMTLRAFNTRIEIEKRKIIDLAKAYFEPAGPDQPSEFAGFIQLASDTLAQRMVLHFKTSFMGMQSKANQAERALAQDLMTDTVNQANPMLGALMSSFPAVSKRLAKNPELWPLIQSVLAKAGSKSGGAAAPGNGSLSSPKFKI